MPRPKKTVKATVATAPVEAIKPKKDIEKMTQIDGKDYGMQNSIVVSKKKTLDEIWGVKFSKFQTSDPEEYEARLKRMTKFDLQQECIKLGRNPHDNRETMIRALLKDCKQYVAAAQTSNLQPKVIKLSDAGREVLHRAANSLV